MKTPITKTKGNPDKLMWKHSMSGNYKVNQAYSLIHQLQTLLNNGEQSITMASDYLEIHLECAIACEDS